jgi:peptidoglycan/xylan/chitin deacetylase (PgdA/CDA1 family)
VKKSTVASYIVILILVFINIPVEAKKANRMVAFTFDDGPNPGFLKDALPFFEANKIPVTFFVIGKYAKKYPDWIKRVYKNGHEIENHTMNHICLVKPSSSWSGCPNISEKAAVEEVKQAMKVIEELTGYRTKFLRPPHFAITPERKAYIENALGVRVLIHGSNSIGSLDWVYRDPRKIFLQVLNLSRSRGNKDFVIVFHETNVTFLALPGIVEFFKKEGYEFVRLDEFVRRNPKAEI